MKIGDTISLEWSYWQKGLKEELFFNIILEYIGDDCFTYLGGNLPLTTMVSGICRRNDYELPEYMLETLDNALSIEIVNKGNIKEQIIAGAAKKIEDAKHAIKEISNLNTRYLIRERMAAVSDYKHQVEIYTRHYEEYLLIYR